MKDFMDRMLPLNNREIVKSGENNFSGLVETFKVMTKENLAGAILCSQGGVLQATNTNDMLKNLYSTFFSALENAGEEIVQAGHITATTQDILDKDVIDAEIYIKSANSSWNNEGVI